MFGAVWFALVVDLTPRSPLHTVERGTCSAGGEVARYPELDCVLVARVADGSVAALLRHRGIAPYPAPDSPPEPVGHGNRVGRKRSQHPRRQPWPATTPDAV